MACALAAAPSRGGSKAYALAEPVVPLWADLRACVWAAPAVFSRAGLMACAKAEPVALPTAVT